MFDIGFSEIVVIAVVALVVLGPEKLPKTARTLGHLFGRLQRYVNDVKSDIKRELELDELRKLQQNVQSAAKEIGDSMNSATREVESNVRDVEAALSGTTDSARADPPAAPAVAPAPGAVAPPPPAAPASPPPDPARQASLPGFDRG
jgi:sec-independent protein translocase protein TatB